MTPVYRTVQEGLSMVSCREGITKSKHVFQLERERERERERETERETDRQRQRQRQRDVNNKDLFDFI